MAAATTSWLLSALVLLGGLGALWLRADLRRRTLTLNRLMRQAREQAAETAAPDDRDVPEPGVELAARAVQDANYWLHEVQCVYPLHIVFGRPKTGCTTLLATVGGLDVCSNLHSAHYLSKAGVTSLQRRAYAMADPVVRPGMLRHLRECIKINGILQARRSYAERTHREQHPFSKPWVISSIREPMTLALSSFFYANGHLLGDEKGQLRPAMIELLLERLEEHREEPFQEHWLRTELRPVFGIDPYARPFPHERGWLCGENAQARYLVIRLESFDRLPEALGEFYGVPPETIRVVTQNQATDRIEAGLYRALKETIRVPRETLDRLYDSPYVGHFYSEGEIRDLKARWVR